MSHGNYIGEGYNIWSSQGGSWDLLSDASGSPLEFEDDKAAWAYVDLNQLVRYEKPSTRFISKANLPAALLKRKESFDSGMVTVKRAPKQVSTYFNYNLCKEDAIRLAKNNKFPDGSPHSEDFNITDEEYSRIADNVIEDPFSFKREEAFGVALLLSLLTAPTQVDAVKIWTYVTKKKIKRKFIKLQFSSELTAVAEGLFDHNKTYFSTQNKLTVLNRC